MGTQAIDFKYPTRVYEFCAESRRPIIVQSGGTSSGKTYSVLQYLLTVAAYVPKQIITVAGQDIPNLRAGAYRDAQNILYGDEFLMSNLAFHNRSNRQFLFTNGSVVEFNSYSDAQDAKSGKRNYLFVNEANGVPYEIFEELQVRTSHKTIIDFNPTAAFWAHEKLQGRDDVDWLDTTFRDNPFISDSIRAKILSYEPTPENIARGTANKYRWMVYGMGQVGRLEGLVFPDFQVTQEWPDQFKWRVFGLDFGFVNDPTAFVEVRYAHGALYWKQHIYKTGLTNPDIDKELQRIGHPRDELIVADSAEPKSIEELRRAGWNVRPAEKGPDSVRQGIDTLNRYPLLVHGGSKDLIEEFSSYTWKKDRNGNALNKPVDDFNHGIDAGRYAVSRRILKPAKKLLWA